MVLLYDNGLSDKKPQLQSMHQSIVHVPAAARFRTKITLNFEEDDDSISEDDPDQVIERGRYETEDEIDEFDESSDEEVVVEDELEIVTWNQDKIHLFKVRGAKAEVFCC